jgi:hypothetical protein
VLDVGDAVVDGEFSVKDVDDVLDKLPLVLAGLELELPRIDVVEVDRGVVLGAVVAPLTVTELVLTDMLADVEVPLIESEVFEKIQLALVDVEVLPDKTKGEVTDVAMLPEEVEGPLEDVLAWVADEEELLVLAKRLDVPVVDAEVFAVVADVVELPRFVDKPLAVEVL